MSDRNRNRQALTELLAPLLAKQDGFKLSEKLLNEGVPAGPVLDVPAVMNHPHTRHRHMAVERDGYRGFGIPIKMSRTGGAVRSAPPKFAAESRAILAEAGYSPAEIEVLIDSGTAPERPKPAKV
jgi:formyl-CoA transferase